ncbi:MAG: DUF5615 family PIN-like protein, partial [Chthonomonadales bacterium]
MITFYTDVNVHAGIIQGLRDRGIDVITAQDDGYRTRQDEAVLDRSTELQRVLISHDQDMLAITSLRLANGEHFAGLVYIAQQNIEVGRCISDLELIAHISTLVECANKVEYLPF